MFPSVLGQPSQPSPAKLTAHTLSIRFTRNSEKDLPRYSELYLGAAASPRSLDRRLANIEGNPPDLLGVPNRGLAGWAMALFLRCSADRPTVTTLRGHPGTHSGTRLITFLNSFCEHWNDWMELFQQRGRSLLQPRALPRDQVGISARSTASHHEWGTVQKTFSPC